MDSFMVNSSGGNAKGLQEEKTPKGLSPGAFL
jgi:hypothetical protein